MTNKLECLKEVGYRLGFCFSLLIFVIITLCTVNLDDSFPKYSEWRKTSQ